MKIEGIVSVIYVHFVQPSQCDAMFTKFVANRIQMIIKADSCILAPNMTSFEYLNFNFFA